MSNSDDDAEASSLIAEVERLKAAPGWTVSELETLLCKAPPDFGMNSDLAALPAAERQQQLLILRIGEIERVKALIHVDVKGGRLPVIDGVVAKRVVAQWARERISGLPDISGLVRDEIEKLQLAEKVAAGRYTLREAAEMIEKDSGERLEDVLHNLKAAAFDGSLPVHEPGRNARLSYVRPGTRRQPGQISEVRDFHDEAFWNDLNAWLEKEEKRIAFRFPAPSALDGAKAEAVPVQASTSPQGATVSWVPGKKKEAQKKAILAAISKLNLNPKSLYNPPGKRGDKSKVREHLVQPGATSRLFVSDKVFDDTWGDMHARGELQDAAIEKGASKLDS